MDKQEFSADSAPTVHNTAAGDSSEEVEPVSAGDALIEEVSIDGMCGVY
ncbi:mycofactocin precursor MftA [Brevibacterium sp. VCM10]|nr:mycofactocin precursor MftA [Brevibacterium sp. VCM10]